MTNMVDKRSKRRHKKLRVAHIIAMANGTKNIPCGLVDMQRAKNMPLQVEDHIGCFLRLAANSAATPNVTISISVKADALKTII